MPTATLQGPTVPTRAPTSTANSGDATPTENPNPNTDVTESAATATTPATETATETQPPTATNAPVTEQASVPTASATTAPTNTEPPMPTDTAASTETDTPTPTETTPPTNTAVPPTETLAPTETSLPTRTPLPTNPPTVEPTTTRTTVQPVANRYVDSTALMPVGVEAPLTAFSSVTGTIDNEHPARLYTYSGVGGEVINVSMQSVSGSLDPFLLIIDPKGRELVRNDDDGTDSYDAAVRGFRLPESGTYIIVASRYAQQYGFSTGDFELRVTKAPGSETPFGLFTQPIAYGVEVTGTIDDNQPPILYTFRGTAGDTVSIHMVATSGDLDTRIALTDNLGNVLAFNDDDMVNLSINAYIENYILPASGYYTIIASHYTAAANSGDYTLLVRLEAAGERGAIHPIYAPINSENSRTLRADGQPFSNFSAGDSLDSNNAELRTDTLLTFFLPPLPENTSLQNAIFSIGPCYEAGGGFSTLGTLTVYQDSYGWFTQSRDFTRPVSGARILTEMDQCDSLDVTELVSSLYASGETSLQIRLSFRDSATNGQDDTVLFTPRLLITPGA